LTLFEDAIAERQTSENERHKSDAREINVLAEQLIQQLSTFATLGNLVKIAHSVGIADLEDAYTETLKLLDQTHGTKLIDLAIKLEHFDGFPEDEVKAAHKLCSKNAFAMTILKGLVISHMVKFQIDRKLRQRVTILFNLKPNVLSLMDSTRKKN
jgi:hypothetical protein